MSQVFNSDRVTIRGPKIDGTFVISFEVGEYEYDNIKDIPKMNDDDMVVVVNARSLVKKSVKSSAADDESEKF